MSGWSALSEAGVSGSGCGGGAVGYLEFEQQRGDVVADRLLGQFQAAGDFVVACPGGKQIEDVAFAGGQFGDNLGGVSLVGSGVEGDDAAGDRGAVDGVAGCDGEHGPDEFGTFGSLEEVLPLVSHDGVFTTAPVVLLTAPPAA